MKKNVQVYYEDTVMDSTIKPAPISSESFRLIHASKKVTLENAEGN
jgi:hypothetical protein